MEVFMDFDLLLPKLLSPLELAICFVIILFAKGRFWAVPIAALAATIVNVWIPDTEVTRAFWYSLLACTIQSFVIYGLFLLKDKFFKK